MRRLIAALALTTASTTVQAMDGNGLHKLCEPSKRIHAASYLTGVMDTVLFTGEFPVRFCPPANGNIVQATDIVCAWLEDFPKFRHKSAAEVASMAMRDAWPCP